MKHLELVKAAAERKIAELAGDTGPSAPATGAPADKLKTIGWNEILVKRDPVKWLCEPLGIVRGGGRANIITAQPGVGKTLSVQALALAVATGGKVFGEFACAQGPVLHVDLDQGEGNTLTKYQLLASGAAIKGTADLECSFERFALTRRGEVDPAAAMRLRRTIEGKALVIIDSLRVLAPEIEEKDSRIATVLTELFHISEDTKATIILIHHSGKGPGTELRGSNAILGVASTCWHLTREREPGAPLLWSEFNASRDRLGEAKPFATARVEVDGGVRLEIADHRPRAEATGVVTSGERQAVARELKDLLATEGAEATAVSKSQLEEHFKQHSKVLGIGRNRLRVVLNVMNDNGEVQLEGSGRGKPTQVYLLDSGLSLAAPGKWVAPGISKNTEKKSP